MKKYIYIIIAVASIFALSGCSNINDNQNTLQEMTFTAGFGDGVQTRATLNPSTKKVSFDAPDYIRIISASNQYKKTKYKDETKKFTTTSGGATATFTGSAVSGDPVYYAIYPYNSYDNALELDGTTIKYVHLSNNQSAASSSDCGWDKNAAIAYATASGSSLQFHHACALLKMTNDASIDVGIGTHANFIIISDSSNIVGTFDLDTQTGTLTYHYPEEDNIPPGTVMKGSDELDVNNVPMGKTVYAAIAPCTVNNLTVYFGAGNNLTEYYPKTKSTPTTFEAGKIYDLGNASEWFNNEEE